MSDKTNFVEIGQVVQKFVFVSPSRSGETIVSTGLYIVLEWSKNCQNDDVTTHNIALGWAGIRPAIFTEVA